MCLIIVARLICLIDPMARQSQWVQTSCMGFLDYRHTTLSRAPLEELSVRLRYRYLTTQNARQETDFHGPGWIITRNSSKRVAIEPRFKPAATGTSCI